VTGDWKTPDIAASADEDEVFPSHLSEVSRHPTAVPCLLVDLGLIPYAEACELQKRIVAARKAGAIADLLLLCEHPHVLTMGRNGKREHLLASDHVLQQKNVEFHASDRGGDITYHGPGQIVGYPILNLAAIRRDVGWYVRMLEETMIRASSDHGITAVREPGKIGIWVSDASQKQGPEKLGAIGVHLSRWVTSHGFAYNVSTDLRHFDLIVPCGIADRKATSLEKILSRRIDRAEPVAHLTKHFGEIFGFRMSTVSRADLLESLERFEHRVEHPANNQRSETIPA
jgi:lipoyl(octanoyl) transferase